MSIIKLKPMAWKLLEQYLKENSYVGQPKYFLLYYSKLSLNGQEIHTRLAEFFML